MTEKSGGPDLFAHPSPSEFDYRPLLLSLRECRLRVVEFMERTGPRNPAYVEAESLIAYIEALARLTRVPGAAKFIRQKPKEPGGKWPDANPPEES